MGRNVQELLKLRVMDILGDMIGTGETEFMTVWRNRADVEPYDKETKEALLPAAFMLDKNIRPLVRTGGHAVGRGMPPPTLLVWMPEIWVVLMPVSDAVNEGVGEKLSAYMAKICKAIMEDDSIMALCGGGGEIEFLGLDTDMQSGGLMEGQMRLDFTFTFTFDATEL